MADVYDDWTKNGRNVLATVRSNSPGIYLRCVANLIPKDLIVHAESDELADYSDAELIATWKAEIAEFEREYREILNVKPRKRRKKMSLIEVGELLLPGFIRKHSFWGRLLAHTTKTGLRPMSAVRDTPAK